MVAAMSDDATLAAVPMRTPVMLGSPRLDAARTRRLAELGLRAGAEVVVLHRTPGGGRVVAVEDSRIAIDRTTLRALPVRTTGVPR